MAKVPTLRAGEAVTANYGWVKPTVGASVDAWGSYINTDLDGIDLTVKSVSNAIPGPSLTTPAMDGTATIGVATTYARADHIHPVDTSLLPKSGGTLTGALTPSQTAGIVGTTTNNNANAGSVGEYITATQATNVTLANQAVANITSISLTAGDWDVEGNASFTFSVGGIAAACAISTTSASIPPPYAGTAQLQMTGQTLISPILPTGRARVLIAATTTVYLVGYASFGSGTCAGQGTIWARRVR